MLFLKLFNIGIKEWAVHESRKGGLMGEMSPRILKVWTDR